MSSVKNLYKGWPGGVVKNFYKCGAVAARPLARCGFADSVGASDQEEVGLMAHGEEFVELKVAVPAGLSSEDIEDVAASLCLGFEELVRVAEKGGGGVSVVAHPGDPEECPVCRDPQRAVWVGAETGGRG